MRYFSQLLSFLHGLVYNVPTFMKEEDQGMIRLTKENIQKVLDANEGFKARTHYKSKNKEEENLYTIVGGALQKRSVGKASFGGSQYDKTDVCDLEQTRRFIRNNGDSLTFAI